MAKSKRGVRKRGGDPQMTPKEIQEFIEDLEDREITSNQQADLDKALKGGMKGRSKSFA